MRAAGVVALIVSAAIAGYFAGQQPDDPGAQSAGAAGEPDVLYWVAPMDPDYRRDAPGKSPMGMDLVPVYAGDASGEGLVTIAPEVRQNLGVRVAPVTRGPFARSLDVAGYTRWDESTITMLHARSEGWLQTFNVASVGDRVTQGQTLYELFSPKLVSAQQEFLSALASGNASLTRASRDRLSALGLTRQQIADLERRRRVVDALPRRADRDAIVIAMDVREGNYVMPSTHVLTLADLATVWVEVDIYERDIGQVHEGQTAVATFDAFPGEVWQGSIGFLYPELDADTRTLRVRLVFDNADGRLRPNMLARVRIDGTPRADVLQIPVEAVLYSASGSRVLIEDGDGRFRARGVTLGARSGERVEVLSGLRDDEQVVTSGQFLLDAEANGAQAVARLSGTGDSVPMNHDGHESMHHAEEGGDGAPADHGDHGDHADHGQMESAVRARAEILERIGPTQLRVRHAPIARLGWPEMTMNFSLADGLTAADWPAGAQVTLTLREGEQGRYRIVAIEPLPDAAAAP